MSIQMKEMKLGQMFDKLGEFFHRIYEERKFVRFLSTTEL